MLPATAAAPSPSSSPDPFGPLTSESKFVYALFEETGLSIYASNLAGTEKELVLSESIGEGQTRMSLISVLDAQISPDGRWLYYKLPPARNATVQALAPVYRIGLDGRSKEKIVEQVERYVLSPDGRFILYSEFTPPSTYQTSDGSIIEAPLYGPGSAWHIYDLAQGQDRLLDTTQYAFNDVGAWVQADHILFISHSAYGGIAPLLFVYDLDTAVAQEIAIPRVNRLASIVPSLSGQRVLVSLVPDQRAIPYGCDIYEITPDWTLGYAIDADPGDGCGGIAWNDEAMFFYEKGTGLSGTISAGETSRSGYDALSSVYAYNFETREDTPILVGNEQEVYRLVGAIPGQGLLVWHASGLPAPVYQLEVRDLAGQYLATIPTGEKEIMVIGLAR